MHNAQCIMHNDFLYRFHMMDRPSAIFPDSLHFNRQEPLPVDTFLIMHYALCIVH